MRWPHDPPEWQREPAWLAGLTYPARLAIGALILFIILASWLVLG
jgi:hypothetical protein